MSQSGSGSGSNNSQWNPILQGSSAIGIIKPNVVFDVYGMPQQVGAPPPPQRLVRTATTETGSSVFASDELLPQNPCPTPSSSSSSYTNTGPASASTAAIGIEAATAMATRSYYTVLDARSSVPANPTEPLGLVAGGELFPRCPPSGVVFCLTELPPRGREQQQPPLRRALSLDYAAVISGECTLALDSGDERHLRQGDIVVNQGSGHRWLNRSEILPCRILLVMVGSERIVLRDGAVLEEGIFRT